MTIEILFVGCICAVFCVAKIQGWLMAVMMMPMLVQILSAFYDVLSEPPSWHKEPA